MFQLFGSLKQFVKPQSCVIDNHIYRLHYKATVLILVAFSLMVTARQYFGDPIDCISRDDIPPNLLDTYCWIHTTFSIENAWKKRVGEEVPYPGVDKTTPNEKRVYHAYYQWVCFVLFFQALAFCVPRYLWKAFEGGLVKNLMLGLDRPILPEEDRVRNIDLVSYYLYRNKKLHNTLFLVHTITEVLNMFNVIIQMMVMDRFLGGEFSSYGWEVLNFTEWDWSVRFDPMIKVFPRLTKCTFHRYGSSGDVQRHDAMCILPINIVNEKIYIFLWFWFYFMAIASALGLLYRAMTILYPGIRVMATHSHCRIVNPDLIRNVLHSGQVGDWFLIDLIAKNIDPINFRDLLIDLDRKLGMEIKDSKNGM
ncbi:innexin inx2 [Dermatophagoides farinae]|uniref:Innexin n=1 Tax=Dermatophagoides farinae TaxID=6954 RepID=A0A922HUR0_DERFA|nr:Structural component of gap junctions [Dermatophagoides farinae]